MCFIRRTIAYLCPNMINFDAVNFSSFDAQCTFTSTEDKLNRRSVGIFPLFTLPSETKKFEYNFLG